jgi:hypothetical protein
MSSTPYLDDNGYCHKHRVPYCKLCLDEYNQGKVQRAVLQGAPRREIATAVLAALIGREGYNTKPRILADHAVNYADALLKRLSETPD